jgi:hypothetical protein
MVKWLNCWFPLLTQFITICREKNMAFLTGFFGKFSFPGEFGGFPAK